MLKRWIHRQIAKLERSYRYDATYLHEVTEASVPAFVKFALFQNMSTHRQSVPKEAWFAARMAGTLSEDCGPCTQLVVDEALRQKVSPLTIAAPLRGDIDEAGEDAALGFRYGMAVAKNEPEAVLLAEEANVAMASGDWSRLPMRSHLRASILLSSEASAMARHAPRSRFPAKQLS